MRIAAKIISVLLNPLLMPTIGLFLIFNTNTYLSYAVPIELKKYTLILVLLLTFIIPFLFILLLRNRGVITSLEMHQPKERIFPYLITILAFVFTLYILTKTPIIPIIFNFIIGATYATFIAFIINFKWKISAHAVGIGGLLGALLCIAIKLNADVSLFVVFSLLAFGLLASARLTLKAHTPLQLYVGFFLGIGTQFIALS